MNSRDTSALIIAVAIWLLLLPLAVAANDPGHDSLYVLRIGDTNVTGSINLTGNVTASFVRFTSKAFGDYLDIVANGTVLGAPSISRIMGATSSLYIDSTGGLYLNTKGGTSSTIQIGDTATNGVTLNVSGVIRQQNVLVCLQNGTNCPGSLGSANITGSGASGYLARWTSTSNLGSSVIYDDGTNVGIGTANPTGKLQVAGHLNVTAGNVSVQSGNGLCLNPTCSARIYYNGTSTVIEGT